MKLKMEGISFALFLAFGIFALLFLGALIYEAIKESIVILYMEDTLFVKQLFHKSNKKTINKNR